MEATLPELAKQNLNILSVEQIKAAYARSQPIHFADPMLARTELPLQETFYPFGFPLQILTNSEEVLAIARESWQGFHQIFEMRPMRFHIGVTEGGAVECPPAPTTRVREHLCSNIADGENFATSDASISFSFIWLTETALAYRDYVRYFFLESSAMFHLAARYTMPIHAACVDLDGNGVLLCGDSGAGKSTLSYACARAGWTYVTDDASFLVHGRADSLIVGNGGQVRFRPSAEDLFPELSGRPILQRAETGKPSIELTTAPLKNVSASYWSRIKHTVFLNRKAGFDAELAPMPAEIARTFILQHAVGLPEVAEQQLAAIDLLLDRGVYELSYSDLDGAIQRLTSLVREGR